MHARAGRLAAALAAVALAVGCTSDDPTPDPAAVASEDEARRSAACVDLADEVAAALEGYVDQLSDGAQQIPTDPTDPDSVEGLEDRLEELASRRATLGCGSAEFRVVQQVLAALDGRGPYAAAVAARLRPKVLPIADLSATVVVEPGDDLAAAVHGAGADAVVELRPGMHTLDQPLVLLRGTHLVGAGVDSTIVTGSSPGAVIVFSGTGTLRLADLSIVHNGSEQASVVVVERGAFDLRDVAVRGGVGSAEEGTGWGLVLSGAAGTGGESGVGLTAVGNDAGGIAVAGDRAPMLEQVTATGNGGCGVCYLDAAAGGLRNAELRDNGLGLSFSGTAAPRVEDLVVGGNADFGVLVDGRAAPVLIGAELVGNGDVGVAVAGAAAPQLQGLVADAHAESGVLVEGEARPTFADATLRGSRIGMFSRGTTVVDVTGMLVEDVVDAHVVYAEDSGGAVSGLTCAADTFGIVLLDATTVDVTDDGCEVIDQRDG